MAEIEDHRRTLAGSSPRLDPSLREKYEEEIDASLGETREGAGVLVPPPEHLAALLVFRALASGREEDRGRVSLRRRCSRGKNLGRIR